MSLLLRKRSLSTPFSYQRTIFFSGFLLLPRAVAAHSPHEARPFRIMLFFFFLPVRCRKSWSGLFVWTGVRGRKQVLCYVYTCDLQCRCEKYILLGIFDMHHLSKASIQIKSIPSCTAAGPAQCLHSTSRLQQLSAFACCGPEGTVSPQLHCFTHDHSM